jgi:hypothetical protein
MKRIIFACSLLLSGTAFAAPSATTTQEIEKLFNALETSNCEFFRNGDWHVAKKASKHLRRKYEYMLKKDLVTSTESFIDGAASKSSSSGTAYQVRCKPAAAVASKDWFLQRLNTLRAEKP